MITRTLIYLSCLLIIACGQDTRLSTQSPEALRFYEDGVKHLEQFYYTEAYANLDSALTHDSTFAMAWGRLALLQHELRNEGEARKNIATAIRLSSHSSEKERLYVSLWYHMIQFDNHGAATADSIVSLFPKEAEGYVMRGRLYEQNSRT